MSTKKKSNTTSVRFEYFAQLPPEIQVMVFDYLVFDHFKFYKKLELSTVSKYLRELIVNSQVSVVKVAKISELSPNRRCVNDRMRVNADWIGRKFWITHLELDSENVSGELAQELIQGMSSLTTVVDRMVSLVDSTEPMPHIKHYGCGELRGLELERIPDILPNLEVLSVNIASWWRAPRKLFERLHTIFAREIQSRPIPMVNYCKAIAPSLKTLFLPVDEEHLDETRAHAKDLGIHIIVDLFDHHLLKKPNVFADQFRANQRPYNFYRYINHTLFREAVQLSYFDTAKYMLESGLTTVQEELGSYRLFPKEFDKCFNVDLEQKTNEPDPFILSPTLNHTVNDDFIEYLISKGLNLNAVINGKTLFESHCSAGPVVKYFVSHGDVDYSVRTLHNKNPFHIMAHNHADEIFQIALNRDKDLTEIYKALRQYDDIVRGFTPLAMIFMSSNNLGMVDVLLNLNLDLSVKDCNVFSLIDNRTSPRIIPIYRKLIKYEYKMEDKWILNLLLADTSSDQLLNDIELFASKGFDLNMKSEGEPWISSLSVITPDVLSSLARFGCDIYARFRGNKTLLFNAACSSNEETVNSIPQIVAEFKFDINHVDDEGFTPLLRRLKIYPPDNNRRVVAMLLEAGANPNIAARGGKHALQMAKQDQKLFELLIEHGANINQRVVFEELKAMNTPLMDIVHSCSKYSWNTLTKKGDTHASDDHGNTLLHITHSRYLEELCQVYKDVNVQNVHGETPLFTRFRSTAEDLTCLMKHKEDITHVSKAGLTALHNALLTGNDKLAIELLQEHCDKLDLSALDNAGRSIGHLITSDDVFDLLHEIILTAPEKERANIIKAFNNVDCFGMTAVHYAMKKMSPSVFGKFISDFKLDLQPDTHVPLLNVAISNTPIKSSDYARLLIEHGASVTCADLAGNTPLHVLCGIYPLADHLIPLLLEKGASITAKNNRGVAPIDILPTIEAYSLPQFYLISD